MFVIYYVLHFICTIVRIMSITSERNYFTSLRIFNTAFFYLALSLNKVFKRKITKITSISTTFTKVKVNLSTDICRLKKQSLLTK